MGTNDPLNRKLRMALVGGGISCVSDSGPDSNDRESLLPGLDEATAKDLESKLSALLEGTNVPGFAAGLFRKPFPPRHSFPRP